MSSMRKNRVAVNGGVLYITRVGLTACRGDGWRDIVENTLMRDFGNVCGGTDGARHAANHLPRCLSGLRTGPSLARAHPQSRACHHAVPNRSPGWPYPGVSGRPYVAYLVQLLSPPVVSPMRVSPDRAVAGPPTRAAAGL